jgi:putative phosphoribosyl transferase
MASKGKPKALRVGRQGLHAELTCPRRQIGLVIFVSDGDAGPGDPLNRHVAEVLHAYHLATLLLDLLKPEEAGDVNGDAVVARMASRAIDVLDMLRESDTLAPGLGMRWHRVGVYASGPGAAAALRTAAQRPGLVCALVVRGARIDPAAAFVPQVQAPTMLIVGAGDSQALPLNRAAMHALQCAKRLEIVPGASHRFDEPGAIDAMAHLAADWFLRHASHDVLR